jgi:hypothetical protein
MMENASVPTLPANRDTSLLGNPCASSYGRPPAARHIIPSLAGVQQGRGAEAAGPRN